VTPATLTSDITVALAGIALALAPVIAKPTVPFGVRVPPERTDAPVIRRQRRVYACQTVAVAVCCTAAAFALPGSAPWWVARLILLAELMADLACVQFARRKVTAVKRAERWFAGHRPVVVTDTGWRASPPRFPARWLLPALAVIALTVVIGVLRYPDLQSHLPRTGHGPGTAPGGGVVARLAVTSPADSVLAMVIAQVYVTALWTGLLLLIYRARPDLDAADPAASAARYRSFLGRAAKAMLTLVACVDLALLLSALRDWQLLPSSGAARLAPALPYAVGIAMLLAVVVRTGQGGHLLTVQGTPPKAPAVPGTADRDDDRFWKGGILYVNRGDPAVVVPRRFGAGWTLNFANRAAWLVVATVAATPVGIAAILAALHR
jgi:uncharacterized membrane protein